MHDISVEGFIESFDRRYPTFILKTLLCDRTTGRNIIWADNEYEALGDGYMGDDEMTVEKITGMNSGVIKPRIAKEQEKQSQRTKSRAEVFTPSWLCNQMNNDLDEAWFGRRDVFNTEIAEETKEEEPRETVPLCVIYDWQNGEPFEFAALKGEAAIMGKKFYAVIGNPPISAFSGGTRFWQ